MSCGSGVGDFIVLSGLAARVSVAYRYPPDGYRHISEEAVALKVLIDKSAQHFKGTNISSDDRHYGLKVLKDCQSVLENLHSIIEKGRFGKDIATLQERLISNTVLLNGFVRSCEYAEIQAKLTAILGLHHTSPRISVTSIASFVTDTSTTETAYRKFCEDLYQIGVTEDIIRQKENEILATLSQGRVTNNKIGGYSVGDEGQLLGQLLPYRDFFTSFQLHTNVSADKTSGTTPIKPSFRITSGINWLQSKFSPPITSDACSLISEAITGDFSAPLYLTANNSPIGIMELLFGKGASTNVIDQNNNTLLHCAAVGGYTDAMKLLLNKHVLIEATNTYNNSPLHLAVENGQTGVAELLLKKGASTQATGQGNNTPLHLAARKGHTSIVEALLNKGAPTEAMNEHGCTPLHIAALGGHTRAVTLLLVRGASTEARNDDNDTPLCIAARNGHTRVELLLAKDASARVMEPLHLAAWKGYIGKMEALLKEGAVTTEHDRTTLCAATRDGHTRIVELLLAQGASTQVRNKDNDTPLYIAARNGHTGAELLLAKALTEVMTPLHLAAWRSYISTLEALLENGSAIIEHDRTTLCDAARDGNTDLVELLLNRGASIEARTKSNDTPLHLAAWKGHTDIVEALLKKGASIEAMNERCLTPLHLAVQSGHTHILELLLAKGASIEVMTQSSDTPLHLATLEGHFGMVEVLLKRGASTEARTCRGFTPLHLAARDGHTRIVRILLNKGAWIGALTHSNNTPLHLAAMGGHTLVAELLLREGASTQAKNNENNTPFDIAIRNGHAVVVDLIIKASYNTTCPTQ